jgi:hypothetical protein
MLQSEAIQHIPSGGSAGPGSLNNIVSRLLSRALLGFHAQSGLEHGPPRLRGHEKPPVETWRAPC